MSPTELPTGASPEERLSEAGLTLPLPPSAVAAYVPFVIDQGLIVISGQVPFLDGKLMGEGVVGDGVSIDDAIACARQCALNALAVAKSAAGELARIERVVRVGVFVAATPAFTKHPTVGNGASEVFVTAFGDAGRHARAAIGCSSLPLGCPVEVEATFRLRA